MSAAYATADIGISGPVNGMGEPDLSGPYLRLRVATRDADSFYRISIGAAEVLAAELVGLLHGTSSEHAHERADAALTFNAFSRENRARCEAPDGFNHALGSWSLSDWMTATLGELGEAANVAKKLNRVRDGITGNKETEAELRAKLRSEIADTFIYLDLMAQAAGFSLADAVRETFDAKSRQIGYSAPPAARAALEAPHA